MGRYVGRQEKTGAEGSGDRCSPVQKPHQKIATAASSPTPIPCFLRGFNRENLQLRSSRSSSFNLSKKFSLHLYVVPVILWCLPKIPCVAPGTAIAASFSSCFF